MSGDHFAGSISRSSRAQHFPRPSADQRGRRNRASRHDRDLGTFSTLRQIDARRGWGAVFVEDTNQEGGGTSQRRSSESEAAKPSPEKERNSHSEEIEHFWVPSTRKARLQILRTSPCCVASVFRTSSNTRIIPINGINPQRIINGSNKCVPAARRESDRCPANSKTIIVPIEAAVPLKPLTDATESAKNKSEGRTLAIVVYEP